MKKSFIVVGLGRFGQSVAKTIESLKGEVLAVDVNEEEVRRVSESVTRCAICDSTSLAALKELGAENMTDGIIAIGNDLQAAILTLMNLKELGVQRVIVRLSDKTYAPIFERLGADRLVIPEEDFGVSLAHSLVSRNVSDYYQIASKYSIVRLKVGDTLEEKTLTDMDARNRYDVNIIGMFRGEEFFIPKATETVHPGDELLVIGKNDKVNRFDLYVNKP